MKNQIIKDETPDSSGQATESPRPALYSILNFNTERGAGMGQYGCTIILAKEAVAELLLTKRDDTAPLIQMLEYRIRHSISHAQPSFRWHEDTWLLTSFQIGGQCACLGIDGNCLGRLGTENVRYNPHNIDSPEHAAAALSTWLLWFECAVTQTQLKQPWARAR